MEEQQQATLIRIAILIAVMTAITVGVYLQFYSPMIQTILTSRENLVKGEQELAQLEGFSKEIKALTEEDLIAWEMAQQEIYRRCPPAENLPKHITFNGSADLFYGTGENIMGQVPQLFLEIFHLVLKGKQATLSLDAKYSANALKIPAKGEGAKPLTIGKSTLEFKLEMNYKELAEFLEQVQDLSRFVKITKIAMTPGKKSLRSSIALETYHCPKGALGDVPEQ